MPATRIDVSAFLTLAAQVPVIDVRSEAEYAHAHFPGALSMPLFNNEERRVIGTAYKQESQQKAIKLGLQYFGPKMVAMIEEVERLLQKRQRKAVVVYCWRGGMRSGGVAWLLDLYGFEVYTLIGGYKAFRRWSMQQMTQDYPFQLVGGFTGSGKTEVLAELKKRGQPVIDLEGLAQHKGSAFGNIGMPAQPSQEMFENRLALALWKALQLACGKEITPGLSNPENMDAGEKVIWIEDESQRIGTVNIPAPLYKTMQAKPVYFLEVPFEQRVRYIVLGYGKSDRERLVNATLRIQKRLGGLETKQAINHIVEGNIAAGFAILLRYYDKQYWKSLQLKEAWEQLVHPISCTHVDAGHNTQLILEQQKQLINAGRI